jgi:hypothetical protein
MPEREIASRGAAKSQFAFAILQQYCGEFLRVRGGCKSA